MYLSCISLFSFFVPLWCTVISHFRESTQTTKPSSWLAIVWFAFFYAVRTCSASPLELTSPSLRNYIQFLPNYMTVNGSANSTKRTHYSYSFKCVSQTHSQHDVRLRRHAIACQASSINPLSPAQIHLLPQEYSVMQRTKLSSCTYFLAYSQYIEPSRIFAYLLTLSLYVPISNSSS